MVANSAPHINVSTPPGFRAKQTLDMLNSDWPIGTVGVATLAAPHMIDPITSTMGGLWLDRPFTVEGIDLKAARATLHLVSSFGSRQDVEIHTDDNGNVDTFDVNVHTPEINSWQDVDAALSKTGARYSYQVSKVDDGQCHRVAGTNTAESLPLASIFKLYVLYAVSETIRDGKLSWDDQLTITDRTKVLGSSELHDLPAGAQISVRVAAEQMIANSDNMTTDLLIDRVGTEAVERALRSAGHHDPASMTPFPTMYALFSVGWGRPDLRDQWKKAVDDNDPDARARLLALANAQPYDPDPERNITPASTYRAEWYGSADDICRVHAGLQKNAVGPSAPVTDVMSVIAGIDLDREKWPYIGAKAGNLPGDLTFSWYAVDKTGQAWVVSFQLNWPRYYSPAAGGWVMTIVKQVFGMVEPD